MKEPRAQKILRFGVASLSLVIIILWGWAFKLRLTLVDLAESPEGALARKTKNSWNQAFAANKKETDQQERTKQEIKTILGRMILNAATATTARADDPATLKRQP